MGKLSVVCEVADIQDKGEGKNAILMLKATGTDPDSGQAVAESLITLVIRGEGGFGGQPGQRPAAPEIPDRDPDAQVALPTREDQALIYRLSGTATPCTATRGSRRSWPDSRGRSCTACAPTGSPGGRWSPISAAVTPRRSRPSGPVSPRRCSPAIC